MTISKTQRSQLENIQDKINKASEKVQNVLDGKLNINELEKLAGIKINNLVSMNDTDIIKLIVSTSDSCERLMADILETENPVYFNVNQDAMLDIINDSWLTEREKITIQHRYGFNCEPMTFKAIGSELGVTGSRAQGIYKKAVRKLRHPNVLTKMLNLYEPNIYNDIIQFNKIKSIQIEKAKCNFENLRSNVSSLGFSPQCVGIFIKAKINRLMDLLPYTKNELLSINGACKDYVDEISAKVESLGYHLGTEVPKIKDLDLDIEYMNIFLKIFNQANIGLGSNDLQDLKDKICKITTATVYAIESVNNENFRNYLASWKLANYISLIKNDTEIYNKFCSVLYYYGYYKVKTNSNIMQACMISILCYYIQTNDYSIFEFEKNGSECEKFEFDEREVEFTGAPYELVHDYANNISIWSLDTIPRYMKARLASNGITTIQRLFKIAANMEKFSDISKDEYAEIDRCIRNKYGIGISDYYFESVHKQNNDENCNSYYLRLNSNYERTFLDVVSRKYPLFIVNIDRKFINNVTTAAAIAFVKFHNKSIKEYLIGQDTESILLSTCDAGFVVLFGSLLKNIVTAIPEEKLLDFTVLAITFYHMHGGDPSIFDLKVLGD